jgi:nucleoside phosphorylase
MFVSAGDIESFDFAKAVGIGLEDVAINLTKLVLSDKPDEIVFVGSGGSYGERMIFDIVESSSATQMEHSFLNKTAYSPIENRIVSHETDLIINSSNYITTDKNVAKLYLDKGISIENMEFYSVLKVAKYFNIKAKAIIIVTNYCDEFAHEDFIKNHKKAMKMLEDYISEK